MTSTMTLLSAKSRVTSALLLFLLTAVIALTAGEPFKQQQRSIKIDNNEVITNATTIKKSSLSTNGVNKRKSWTKPATSTGSPILESLSKTNENSSSSESVLSARLIAPGYHSGGSVVTHHNTGGSYFERAPPRLPYGNYIQPPQPGIYQEVHVYEHKARPSPYGQQQVHSYGNPYPNFPYPNPFKPLFTKSTPSPLVTTPSTTTTPAGNATTTSTSTSSTTSTSTSTTTGGTTLNPACALPMPALRYVSPLQVTIDGDKCNGGETVVPPVLATGIAIPGAEVATGVVVQGGFRGMFTGDFESDLFVFNAARTGIILNGFLGNGEHRELLTIRDECNQMDNVQILFTVNCVAPFPAI